jgi:protein-S-isoprenylcysteine O-methyltransferase Ste14
LRAHDVCFLKTGTLNRREVAMSFVSTRIRDVSVLTLAVVFRPIMARLRGMDEPSVQFMVRGPYRWVRHPLYSSAIILLWAWPHVTLDRLMFNVLWTAWIYVGTCLEERDLVQDFGDAYREYQRHTPMLVPWRGPIQVIRPNQVPSAGA